MPPFRHTTFISAKLCCLHSATVDILTIPATQPCSWLWLSTTFSHHNSLTHHYLIFTLPARATNDFSLRGPLPFPVPMPHSWALHSFLLVRQSRVWTPTSPTIPFSTAMVVMGPLPLPIHGRVFACLFTSFLASHATHISPFNNLPRYGLTRDCSGGAWNVLLAGCLFLPVVSDCIFLLRVIFAFWILGRYCSHGVLCKDEGDKFLLFRLLWGLSPSGLWVRGFVSPSDLWGRG